VPQGAPASIKIYGLVSLNSPPTSQKTFFKADRAQIKWNTLGTQVLLLTQTEVDNSNKSYYGETGMYLLTAAGHFECRVTLDKEGPIHDFAWSPNSKEFGVVYGCEWSFPRKLWCVMNRGLYRYARQDGTL
jgi:translation initiation factor 2A